VFQNHVPDNQRCRASGSVVAAGERRLAGRLGHHGQQPTRWLRSAGSASIDMPRHRHQGFIRFLQLIHVKTPDLDLHLIVDNDGTHKHPRFHLHFIPTSSSWLNMVERWFREITDKRIRRGSFQNVPDLIAAINHHVQTHNQNPRVFVWSASGERIMSKSPNGKEALETTTRFSCHYLQKTIHTLGPHCYQETGTWYQGASRSK
jgi:DDE superfamily endonuclease